MNVCSIEWCAAGRLARLDAIDGAIVTGELTRLERQLYLADQTAGVSRTRSERLAAALVEMATRSAATPADAHRPKPLFTPGGVTYTSMLTSQESAHQTLHVVQAFGAGHGVPRNSCGEVVRRRAELRGDQVPRPTSTWVSRRSPDALSWDSRRSDDRILGLLDSPA